MFSNLTRAQHVLSFGSTVAGFIALAIIASSLFQMVLLDSFNTESQLGNVRNVVSVKYSRRFGARSKSGKENARFAFDLETDLSPLFTWNTKQVFTYLTLEYNGTSSNAANTNEITIWDKIITSSDDAYLDLRKEKSKYSVYDVEDSFNNREAVVKLHWNVQPRIGLLLWGTTKGDQKVTFASPPESKAQ